MRPGIAHHHCHIDPDLQQRYITPPASWKPAFGQCGASEGYLRNTVHIQPGDLFLFFGNYHMLNRTVDNSPRFTYKRRKGIIDSLLAPENTVQLIWGYMQVGKILTTHDEIKHYYWHPHANTDLFSNKNNTLYIPTERLSFNDDYPGFGLLNFSENRLLTMPGARKATWKENPVYQPENIIGKRKNSAKGSGIFYSGIWQELGLQESSEAEMWAKRIICGQQFSKEEKDLLRSAAKIADSCFPDMDLPYPKPKLFDLLSHIEDGELTENETRYLVMGAGSHTTMISEGWKTEAIDQAENRFDIVSKLLNDIDSKQS